MKTETILKAIETLTQASKLLGQPDCGAIGALKAQCFIAALDLKTELTIEHHSVTVKEAA